MRFCSEFFALHSNENYWAFVRLYSDALAREEETDGVLSDAKQYALARRVGRNVIFGAESGDGDRSEAVNEALAASFEYALGLRYFSPVVAMHRYA